MSLFKLHPAGPTPGIPYLSPRTICRSEHCEEHVNIGLFFDGSGNNMYAHVPLRKDSNVARLFRAYKEDHPAGYYRHYMPGVGTRFPQIGENDETGRTGGMGMGLGGDSRIVYAMLMVLNSLYRRVRGEREPLVQKNAITALCRNGLSFEGRNPLTGEVRLRANHPEDTSILASLGLRGGLLDPAIRRHYMRRLVSRVRGAMEGAAKPKILEIFIDVFGFSRGAAEARVFLHWMGELFEGEMLCGVPAKFRFAGLFDTVASVIWPNSANGSGHLGWAKPEHLRIPARVHACVHYVAMHEPRASFPVDWVMQGRTMPTNCHEYLLPGAHSDVGGAYLPAEQGKGVFGRDDEKLPQIALNLMYDAARAAGVTALEKARAREVMGEIVYSPFAVHPQLQKSYNAFMAHERVMAERWQLGDWWLTYLAWRYQVRFDYCKLPFFSRAMKNRGSSDAKDIGDTNLLLRADFESLELPEWNWSQVWPEIVHHLLPMDALTHWLVPRRGRRPMLPEEAIPIFDKVRRWPRVNEHVARFFADYVHDSFAGFKPMDDVAFGIGAPGYSWEFAGYLRYRRNFFGDDQALPQIAEERKAS